MNEQVTYYENKLKYEMDPSDLFEALLNGENVVVIDARKPEGFEAEHIPGAINLPHRTINETTTKHFDKNVLYVAYCDGIGCNASTRAALNLAHLGFKVNELIGGIQWWKLDGYETEGLKSTHKEDELQVNCAC